MRVSENVVGSVAAVALIEISLIGNDDAAIGISYCHRSEQGRASLVGEGKDVVVARATVVLVGVWVLQIGLRPEVRQTAAMAAVSNEGGGAPLGAPMDFTGRIPLALECELRSLDGSDFTIATHSSVLACWVERARLLAGLWIADCFGDGPAVAAHPPSCGILGRHGWLELEQWDGCAGFSDLASAQPDLMKRAVAKNCRWVSVSDLGPHGGAKIAIRAGRCGAAWNVGAWICDIEDAGHGGRSGLADQAELLVRGWTSSAGGCWMVSWKRALLTGAGWGRRSDRRPTGRMLLVVPIIIWILDFLPHATMAVDRSLAHSSTPARSGRKTLPPFVWMGPIGRSDPRRSWVGRQSLGEDGAPDSRAPVVY
ncbi:hypothetical protein ACLOJK_028220 [Asimina triloba]